MPSLSLVIVASAQAAVKHRGMIKGSGVNCGGVYRGERSWPQLTPDPYAGAATNPARHARDIVTHEVRKVVTNS